ncbi:putative drug/proton antiporter YHK8-like protein 2 [Podospora conica]|nr:putative drug/proton antiporter YHK8-like protein 2 [Schizothecium conicum]
MSDTENTVCWVHRASDTTLCPGHHDRTQRNLDSSAEITYTYLTFETPLPLPNIKNSSTKDPEPEYPPPPDLSPFTDPRTWPASRKYLMLALSCFATFLTGYSSGSYAPPVELMKADLGVKSNIAVLAGITSFCTGFGFAPMFLAPFSEMNGRYPVFVAAGIVYVIFQAVCGLVRTLAGMIVARALVGIGGSVFSTMVGGVIADMWDKEGRNMPMALFTGSVLLGSGLGPLSAALMTHYLKNIGSGNTAAWKWIFWHQVIMGTVCMVALVWLFKESRGPVLLSRKAKALNKWYAQLEEEGHYGVFLGDMATLLAPESTTADSDDEKGSNPSRKPSISCTSTPTRIRWIVKEDEERSSLAKMITISVTRPFHLLFTEPVVFFFSLWVSFAWGVLYLTYGSIPLVFQRQYGWDQARTGLVFLSLAIGAVLGTALGILQEKLLHHPNWTSPSSLSLDRLEAPTRSDRFWALVRRRFPASAPESRLYITCFTSALLPLGLFLFGFTARPHIHWAVPALGLVLATVGILMIYLSVFNYFADSYNQYASSALAAQSLCRNLVAGVFPLVTQMLIVNLGETRATGLLGGIAVGLSVVPWVLVFYGERIRARSPFASGCAG